MASGWSKQSMIPARIVVAEKYWPKTLLSLSLLRLAAPMTSPIQSSTPAMSDQQSERLDFSSVSFNSRSSIVDWLGVFSAG